MTARDIWCLATGWGAVIEIPLNVYDDSTYPKLHESANQAKRTNARTQLSMDLLRMPVIGQRPCGPIVLERPINGAH